MFLTLTYDDARSPRVCGDVSVTGPHSHTSAEFSPRMRGCFRSSGNPRSELGVLPAYAGMFPAYRLAGQKTKGSPRVCGDVSGAQPLAGVKRLFSPRMRGCFRHQKQE